MAIWIGCRDMHYHLIGEHTMVKGEEPEKKKMREREGERKKIRIGKVIYHFWWEKKNDEKYQNNKTVAPIQPSPIMNWNEWVTSMRWRNTGISFNYIFITFNFLAQSPPRRQQQQQKLPSFNLHRLQHTNKTQICNSFDRRQRSADWW